jgi:Uma2 family endonuclease
LGRKNDRWHCDNAVKPQSMSTQPIPRLTVEQYLKVERAADFRSEYIEGEVFAMAGGSKPHALIAMEVGARLNEQCAAHRAPSPEAICGYTANPRRC